MSQSDDCRIPLIIAAENLSSSRGETASNSNNSDDPSSLSFDLENTFSSDEELPGEVSSEYKDFNEATKHFNEAINLSQPYLSKGNAENVLSKPKKKSSYIRKYALPRILKRDFRRDLPIMLTNAVNSGDRSVMETFFLTACDYNCHYLIYNSFLYRFNTPALQQACGLPAIVASLAHKPIGESTMTLRLVNANIIQRNDMQGSKVTIKLEAKISPMIVPSPMSLSQLNNYCFCSDEDQQRLRLIKQNAKQNASMEYHRYQSFAKQVRGMLQQRKQQQLLQQQQQQQQMNNTQNHFPDGRVSHPPSMSSVSSISSSSSSPSSTPVDFHHMSTSSDADSTSSPRIVPLSSASSDSSSIYPPSSTVSLSSTHSSEEYSDAAAKGKVSLKRRKELPPHAKEVQLEEDNMNLVPLDHHTTAPLIHNHPAAGEENTLTEVAFCCPQRRSTASTSSTTSTSSTAASTASTSSSFITSPPATTLLPTTPSFSTAFLSSSSTSSSSTTSPVAATVVSPPTSTSTHTIDTQVATEFATKSLPFANMLFPDVTNFFEVLQLCENRNTTSSSTLSSSSSSSAPSSATLVSPVSTSSSASDNIPHTSSLAPDTPPSASDVPAAAATAMQRCIKCGKCRFSNPKLLDNLTQPLIVNLTLYPQTTYYLNEQHQAYRIETIIPVEGKTISTNYQI